MSHGSERYLPFSQREGLAPIPPQLQLGEVSDKLRRLLYYAVKQEIDRETFWDLGGPRRFHENGKRIMMDLWVRHFERDPDRFESAPSKWAEDLKVVVTQKASIGLLFDLVEFLVRHSRCSDQLRRDLAQAFIDARAAYRIYDNKFIAAIGTVEQADAYERAIADAERRNASGARKHLIDAGVALRKGDWAGSVRESIHAVESVACELAPDEKTLSAALKQLAKLGHLHGRLATAFDKLYAYSSDEKGVRHALVFDDAEAKVDETDALFMLGACASFVSYLLARSRAV